MDKLKTNEMLEECNELEEYLKYEFIPRYVKFKKYINEETNNVETYPSISLNVFQSLELDSEDIKYTCLYLYQAGVLIGNKSPMFYYDNFSYNPKVDLNIVEDRSLYIDYFNTNNAGLIDKIVEQNVNLVKYVAYHFSKITGFDYEELESLGYEGVLKALDRYNPLANESFSKFAYSYVEYAIKLGFANLCGFKRNKFFAEFNYAKVYVERLFGEKLEDNHKLIDYVIDLMVKRKNIAAHNAYQNKDRVNIVYHEPLSEDMVSNELAFEVEFESISIKNSLLEGYKHLTEQEILVLELYYGIKDGNKYTLKDLASILGVSIERIRQIKDSAFLKLKAPHRVRRLKDKLGKACDVPSSYYASNIKTGKKL